MKLLKLFVFLLLSMHGLSAVETESSDSIPQGEKFENAIKNADVSAFNTYLNEYTGDAKGLYFLLGRVKFELYAIKNSANKSSESNLLQMMETVQKRLKATRDARHDKDSME